MIALLVLISLQASFGLSRDFDEELQFMQDMVKNMEVLAKKKSIVPATTIISDPTVYDSLKTSYRNVLTRELACELQQGDHDWWKRRITNKTTDLLKLTEARKIEEKKGLNCENATSFTHPSYQFLCDNSTSFNYYRILMANDLMKIRKNLAKEEIEYELPCKNELWGNNMRLTNNRFYLNNRTDDLNEYVRTTQKYANYTKHKVDMGQDIQLAYRKNATRVKGYCLLTPQVHNNLRKLRYVDIHFRIAEDLIRMKFLSMVSYDFCNKNYLLSKCICDEQSVASFCMMYFYKQAVLVFVNETLCDNYSVGLTSAAPTLSFYSIIAIFLLASLRF